MPRGIYNRTAPKPDKKRAPSKRKFETIPIDAIPGKYRFNENEPDYRAALALADTKPDSAVIIYDSMGDIKKASEYRGLMRRWLKNNKLSAKYDAVNRQDKVYVWKTS